KSCIPILISACASLLEAGAQCGKSARWDLCGGQEAISVPTATRLSVGNISSTIQSKTRFLSANGLGDVIAGAFSFSRVEIVLNNDVRVILNRHGLWSGFRAESAHQVSFFSY
ncbi:MAG: hypothetical protein ACYC64_15000, partial [Armatimonadota bacterium]